MISKGIKSISILASRDYNPLHLLYFSWVLLTARAEEAKRLLGGEGGVGWGITRKDGMMLPRWSRTDYLHRAAAVFWEVFEASSERVVVIHFNIDNYQSMFANSFVHVVRQGVTSNVI